MKKLGYKKLTMPKIIEPIGDTSGIPTPDDQTLGLTHLIIIKHI